MHIQTSGFPKGWTHWHPYIQLGWFVKLYSENTSPKLPNPQPPTASDSIDTANEKKQAQGHAHFAVLFEQGSFVGCRWLVGGRREETYWMATRLFSSGISHDFVWSDRTTFNASRGIMWELQVTIKGVEACWTFWKMINLGEVMGGWTNVNFSTRWKNTAIQTTYEFPRIIRVGGILTKMIFWK